MLIKSSKPQLVLVGGGGHCKVVVSILNKLNIFEIVGISDLPSLVSRTILGVEVKYCDDDLYLLHKSGTEFAFITLGSIENSLYREKLFDLIKKIGFKIPTIISINSIIDESVSICEGSVIMPGVIINTGVFIGKNSIINTGSIIDHDSRIGDHVHIAPGVTLSGSVKIGNCSHVGTGSTVIQNIEIGKNVLVGAGSVVVKNVVDGIKIYGNPAKERN